MSLLQTTSLSVSYDGQPALRGLSFSVEEGEILGIVGESGSGKSTVLKVLTGLLGPSGQIAGGSVRYQGRDLIRISPRERRTLLGPEIGMVFQDARSSFCPVRRVGAQLCEIVRAHRSVPKDQIRREALDLMDKLGLEDPARVWESWPFQLSGGMSQRVGLCAALLLRPRLLLADEPTSALDVTVRRQVVEELLRLRAERGTAIVLVAHDMGVVRAMADRILVLREGSAVEQGPCSAVLDRPQSPYTQALMEAVPHLRRPPEGA